MRAAQRREIRRFGNDFEVIALRDIEGAAQHLGVMVEAFAERLEYALRTGLGVLCKDPRAGVQPGTDPGEVCTKQQNCPTCSQMFFVASPENVCDLILWHDHLRAGAETLQHTHPHRWAELWAPWLVLAEVLLQKVKRSYGDVLEDAQELAQERRVARDVHFPPLD